MRRFFAGIKIPEHLGEKLMEVGTLLAPQVPAKRWYGVEHFHITTNFLGELDEGGLTQAIGSLEEVVPRHQCFQLSLQGAGSFPRARVIWIGAGGETEKLFALQYELRQAFRPLGAEKFAYAKFTPHITLARTGDISTFDAESIPVGSILDDSTWRVEQVCLFESVMDPAGARYPIVHQVPLKD
ncbi:RNA 2',3'-cyclic phosphodiesterase [Effusibacillus consociatus]|uniref:RNA 2',3'-cyclic phosphodiesterase n=1 Tax=Effusibacillus consociatus TaxID=1117041 RepID=A0ABV9Q3V5_9BACL